MNKKYLMFGLLGLFMVAVVSAGLIQYYGQVHRDVTVSQAVDFTGVNSDNVVAIAGQSVSSNNLGIESKTSVNVPLEISTTPVETGITHTEEYILSASDGTGVDSGVYVTAADAGVTTLNDLENISWDVNVLSGYIAHVDVLIDTTGDGVIDDALVFEYAKYVSDCEVNYPTGEVDTFGTHGIVDSSALAWLATAEPGPGCTLDTEANFHIYTLSDWKSGRTANSKTIPADVTVIGFDVEIDNWISDSTSDVKNILINGESVELTLKPTESLDFRVLTDFGLSMEAGIYTVTTTVDVRD